MGGGGTCVTCPDEPIGPRLLLLLLLLLPSSTVSSSAVELPSSEGRTDRVCKPNSPPPPPHRHHHRHLLLFLLRLRLRDDKARSATCGQLEDAAERARRGPDAGGGVGGGVARRQAAFPATAEATRAMKTKRRPLDWRVERGNSI